MIRQVPERVHDPVEWRRVELRASEKDRVISGTVMRYGDTARLGIFRERFGPDALAWEGVPLNVQHDRTRLLARYPGGGLDLRTEAGAVHMRATLPATRIADDALEAVRAGLLRGLSMEFRAVNQDWSAPDEKGVVTRTVHSARLTGIGLVDDPAYSQSELRALDAWAKAAVGGMAFAGASGWWY